MPSNHPQAVDHSQEMAPSAVAFYAVRTETVFAFEACEPIQLTSATEVLMRKFAEGDGYMLPSRIRRQLWPEIKWAVKQLSKQRLAAIEVLNNWRGNLAMACVYRPICDDGHIHDKYLAIRVDVEGTVRWGEFAVPDHVRKRIIRAWELNQSNPGEWQYAR